MKELGRLSFVVRQIDFDTNVFPEGAYKMLPLHEIRRNENFHGLNPKDLTNLSKFQHFRNVITEDKKTLIEKEDIIFQFNFYDSLDQDPIKSIKYFKIFRMLVDTIRYNQNYC